MDYTRVWYTDKRNTQQCISFWQPVAPPGYLPLGHVPSIGLDPPADPVLVYRNDSEKGSRPSVKPAREFHLIWRQHGRSPVTMWEPILPQGYRALGTVVVPDAEQPGSKEVLCVREDLCAKTGIFDSPIWKFEPPIMQGGLNVQRLKTHCFTRASLGFVTGAYIAETQALCTEMATDDLPELRAYKLGKRRWSYNHFELVLHQDDACGPGITLAAAGAVYKKESDLEELCTDPESQVGYEVQLENGAVVMVVLYLVYADPSNSCCQTDVLPQQRSQADMHDSYQWNLVKRSACSKGCQGPLLHTVRRQSGKDLLGSACSQPIRVMANNDIPHGAAHIPLVVNVRKDWVGWQTKNGLVSSHGASANEQAEQLYGDAGLTVDQPTSPGFTGVVVGEGTAGLHGQQQDELPADLLNGLSQFDQRQLLGTDEFNCCEEMAFALPLLANGISGETSYVQLLDDLDSSGRLGVPEGCFVSSNCCVLRHPSSPVAVETTCDDADGEDAAVPMAPFTAPAGLAGRGRMADK
ncbi:hypothetical protein WJX82_008555 [Trebouxia sp. C0006]